MLKMNSPSELCPVNKKVSQWIQQAVDLCQPNTVHLCNGSEQEFHTLAELMVQTGTATKLNESKRPNSYAFRSHRLDVARVESSTFICSKSKEDAGPTNNWSEPLEMERHLRELFTGCMKGRTMYVIPFCMGPLHSKFSIIGIQVTDSPYVVCNMSIMTHMGTATLQALGDGDFIPCMHSVGVPLVSETGETISDVPWPCNPEQRVIAHFPETRAIWSYGSGYGGNALLGKKCLALRIASVMARDDGWMAEHMLILGLTNPQGQKKYICAAFPSSCGKTNLAMLRSSIPGWRVECIGDDIAWLRLDADGMLRAVNPESGFFGVAHGTSMTSNPSAMKTITKNTLFTNCALTDEGDVWWESMTETPPKHLTSWLGEDWSAESGKQNGKVAAQPNARYTARLSQCPVLDPAWNDPKGVPISAIIFGGRRDSVVPLVYQAKSWQHGVFLGAGISSQTTAAASGAVEKLRHDPFAMLPFCGYNMGDYFAHWLSFAKRTTADKLPKIFTVNWFRKSASGKWLWPGFGENIRVLKWIFERCDGGGEASSTPIGYLPAENAIDLSDLSVTPATLKELLVVDNAAWLKEVAELKEYFAQFTTHLPEGIQQELADLESRLRSEISD